MRILQLLGALAIAFAWSVVPIAAQVGEPAWLGVKVETITPQLAQEHGLVVPLGALVVDVEADSPAATADLRRGDVILFVNATPTNDREQFEAALRTVSAGANVDLVRVRDAQTSKMTIALAAGHVRSPTAGTSSVAEPQFMLETGGHRAVINHLTFTHTDGGKYLISAGSDKVVRVWNWREGTTERILRGEVATGRQGQIFALALSPDDRWLAVAGWMAQSAGEGGHVIRLYDFRSGELKALLRGHKYLIDDLAFSPDGHRLISGGHDKTAILWDVENTQLLRRLEGHTAEIYAVSFTPDGERAVTGSYDTTLRLWRVNDGELIAELKGHGTKVRSLAVSPKDGIIASGDRDGEIRLWDGRTGQPQRILAKQDGEVGALRFSPNGRWLLSGIGRGKNNNVHVWDVATGRDQVVYKGHDNIVIATAISPDGQWAATGGGNDYAIHVWELTTGQRAKGANGQPITLSGTGAPTLAVAMSSDGSRIAWGTGNAYLSHNDRGPLNYQLAVPRGAHDSLTRPEPVTDQSVFVRARETLGPWRLSHKPGGDYGYTDAVLVIAKDGAVHAEILRDAADGYGHTCYTFTGDGKTIVSGGSNGHLIAYSLDGKELAKFVGHEGDVWAVASSPDGRLLISASADQTVRLWPLTALQGDKDGQIPQIEPIVSLFRGKDGQWVMWTPQGYYTSSPEGDNLVGWQINNGASRSAEYYTARQLKRNFYRPGIVERALVLANGAAAVGEVRKVDPESLRFDLNALLSRRPPALSIVQPGSGTSVAAASTDVVIDMDETAQSATRLEVFVNDRQITPADARGFIPVTTGDHSHKISIPLAAGENRVKIRATNDVGATEKDLVLIGSAPGALDRKGTLFIVAIGTDKYPHVPRICKTADGSCDLHFAGADARSFSERMSRVAGAMHINVKSVLLTNGAAPAEKEPTAANIVDALDLLRQSGENDTVMVFLSGHGVNDEVQGRKRYLYLPTDAVRTPEGGWRSSSVFSWSALEEGLSKARGRRMLFVDTCHAANSYSGQIVKNAHDDNIIVFSAADRDTEAEERRSLGHGVFTYVILRALQGEATNDREIRLFDFASFVDREVRKMTGEAQQPEYNIQRVKNFVLARVR